MVTMKSLVTLVLTALVLASSMAVVASEHKDRPEDGDGGPKNDGGKPDDAGAKGNSENAGGKPDDAGAKGNSENAGGKPDDAGSQGDSGNAGEEPDDAGSRDPEDAGGKPDDAGSQGDAKDAGGKPDDAGAKNDTDPKDGPDKAGGPPDDAGAKGGPDDADGGPDRSGTDSRHQADREKRPGTLRGDDGRAPRPERGPDDRPATTTGRPDRTDEEGREGPDRGQKTLRTQGGEEAPAPAIVEDADDGFRTARAADSPRPRVDFDARAAELKLQTDSETPGLTSRIDGLVEYLDENGNGAYDIGEAVLDRIPVRDLEPVIRHGIEGADTREVVYTLPGGGTLTLVFHLGTSGQVGAKYDILVVDHPFHDPASRLAIGVSAAVDGGVRLLEIEGQPAVAGQDGDDVAYLRWVTEALVDGDTVPVGWSVHISHSETVESAIIYWSYPQGMRILHDPEVGITHLPPDLVGDAELFVYGLVLTGTTLLVGHEFRRRRTW